MLHLEILNVGIRGSFIDGKCALNSMQNNVFEGLDINHFIIVPFPTAGIPYNAKRFGIEQFPNVKMSLLNLPIHVQWHSKKKIYISKRCCPWKRVAQKS
jgi:hypothetical protein